MDTMQTNRVNMLKTVDAYFDENTPAWSDMAPLATAVAELKSKIAAVDDAARKQETPTGAADNKAAAREALEEVLFLACEALGVLGHGSSDHDLTALTSVSMTTLQRLGAEELSNRAAQIVTEANARKTELATLKVTQAISMNLQAG